MPFVKGDPRINRNGRPKDQMSLRNLIQQVLNEEQLDKDGNPAVINGHKLTRVELVVRKLAASDDPRKIQMLLEYAYGKVAQAQEVTGKDGEAIKTEQTTIHDLSRLSPEELNELRTIVAKTAPDDSPITE